MDTMTYDGVLDPSIRIASDTDPWVEVNGVPVDWTTSPLPRVECPCEDHGKVIEPGVLEAMNSNAGVQRCDMCAIYDSDLDAALALAKRVGGVVRFHPHNPEED